MTREDWLRQLHELQVWHSRLRLMRQVAFCLFKDVPPNEQSKHLKGLAIDLWTSLQKAEEDVAADIVALEATPLI
jgi:hypothetical protein